jgi:hypothetical protein
MTQDPAIHEERNRFIKSVAGAVLIASLGFALVFCFFAWLPYQTLTWLDTLPPAKATFTLRMTTVFARAFSLFLGVVTPPGILVIVAHKQRSRQRHTIKLT